jgi:hypothetical protein
MGIVSCLCVQCNVPGVLRRKWPKLHASPSSALMKFVTAKIEYPSKSSLMTHHNTMTHMLSTWSDFASIHDSERMGAANRQRKSQPQKQREEMGVGNFGLGYSGFRKRRIHQIENHPS